MGLGCTPRSSEGGQREECREQGAGWVWKEAGTRGERGIATGRQVRKICALRILCDFRRAGAGTAWVSIHPSHLTMVRPSATSP